MIVMRNVHLVGKTVSDGGDDAICSKICQHTAFLKRAIIWLLKNAYGHAGF